MNNSSEGPEPAERRVCEQTAWAPELQLAAFRSGQPQRGGGGGGVGEGWTRRGLLDARRRIIVLPGDLFHGEKWESVLPTGPLSRACGDAIQVSKRAHGRRSRGLMWHFLSASPQIKKKSSSPQPEIRQLAAAFKAAWTVSAAVLMLDVSGTRV